MPITKLYHTWVKKITQLLPNERVTRVRNLAWLLTRIYASKSVHLSKVANKIPGTTMLLSITRRLDQFLENAEFRVCNWYEPIEEMFGDLKKNGFDMESTHLRSVFKLHRLTFAVVLLFLELVTSGSKIIKNGLRRLVDRSDRRDLCIFRIGLYMRERHLANSKNFILDFYPLL
jgi:hypothetical protein